MSSIASGTVPPAIRRFRLRLFLAMGAVVAALTGAGLYYAERHTAAAAERDCENEFRAAFERLRTAREMRVTELARRCQALAHKSRIHAALEDDALDLLYPSSHDELSDLIDRGGAAEARASSAIFYRFLDGRGAVIAPPGAIDVGALSPEDAARIALERIPAAPQLGYLVHENRDGLGPVTEIITTPILSTTTGRPIAALVVGLASHPLAGGAAASAMTGGIWTEGRLVLGGPAVPDRPALIQTLAEIISRPSPGENAALLTLTGAPYRLLSRSLNPGSVYPTAYEIGLFPLDIARARQRTTRWQILGGGALILLGALGASRAVADRLSRPVEKLAVESQVNAVERSRAQAALESTQVELQRSARFSANASHQLKTPVAVMRAGLDELLARDDLPAAVRDELTALTQETARLSSVVDDLLLLSRMDAGRLRINFEPIDLAHLVASAIDDFSIQPDPFGLTVRNELPGMLPIVGERRYVGHILHNLLENARRYNRTGGIVKVSARAGDREVCITIGNTGRVIPPEFQAQIFERFHRAGADESLPGNGLGLNLARELARLHNGDVRLRCSADDWTEFEIIFQLSDRLPPPPGPV